MVPETTLSQVMLFNGLYRSALQSSLLVTLFKRVQCKGIAVIGSSAGQNEVCADCGDNYTNEELQQSLTILVVIMGFFLIILCCQCIARVVHYYRMDKLDYTQYYDKCKSLPPPPYVRSLGVYGV